MMSFKNFNYLTNSFDKIQNNFKLLKCFDIFEEDRNVFDYSQKIKENLDDKKLNIIEGGSCFYFYYFLTDF